MLLFKTLVHKGAMPVAQHAVRTFAGSFSEPSLPVPALLEMHSDGSLDSSDWDILESAARNLPTRRVEPEERREVLSHKLDGFPITAKLLERGGYMAKTALLAAADQPFFYFDSDIIWLRPFIPTSLPRERTAFSTETWSWYYGIQKPGIWIREKIPSRVNSGFAWMPEPFPFDRMERMLRDGLYTPDHIYSTDQEILAYLFPEAMAFSLGDFFRTRVGVTYELKTHPAVAVHFPGAMWKPHLNQIENFQVHMDEARPLTMESPSPLSWPELLRMYGLLAIEQNYLLQRTANLLRRFLRK